MAPVLVTPLFKALSALLSYPTEELVAASSEIGGLIASDARVSTKAREDLTEIFVDLQSVDLIDLQERYVDLFDRTRKLSLHLFEHVHGESRDRGQAMIDLAALYEKSGLMLAANELPDYLPLFLEYLATRPFDEARALLANTSHILALLEERLAKRAALYAAVFTALLSIAGGRHTTADAPSADEADDLVALDAAWEETAVTFGPGDNIDTCSADRLRMQIRAGKRDARVIDA